ncbi:histidine kinase [Kordiimonas aquimaris]|uniref:histidine kinase n=1 Tax=Kordiimonas aquimaris TaxID=707591 RepID=UPI0021CE782A|nr:sensor histidine kinase [Kordiimonas aquimaris]
MFKILQLLFICFLFLSHSVNAYDIINMQGSLLESAAKSPDTPDKDSSWQPFTGLVINSDTSQWFHMEIMLKFEKGEQVHNPLSLGVKVSGVYDFYWDGELIGSNHYKGTTANQYSRVLIPLRNLTPGHHIIKMRITPYGMNTGDSLGLEVRPAAVQSDFFGVHSSVISTFFVATAALFTACYLLLIRQTVGAQPGLWAAIFVSISIAAIILLQEGRQLFSYPYGWQPRLDMMLPIFTIIVFLSLPWFVFARLGLKSPLKWMTIIPVVAALSFVQLSSIDHDIRAFGLLSVTLMLIACYGWWRGLKTSRLFVFGFALSLTALWADPNLKHLFLIVITLMLAIDLAIDIKRRTADAMRQKLISERLRADLIKRNIRPHFLMNSLTALMEWVETDPDEAVEFIDGLATEFRMLDQFSEKTTVTLDQELTLCQTHLDLMSQRLNGTFILKTENIDRTALIPPGVFHTLVENTFSHNNLAKIQGTFNLRSITSGDSTTYIFSAPMGNLESVPRSLSTTEPTNRHMGTGAGTRYILARLEEFCGTRFSFTSEQVSANWQTTIQINQARL